MARTAPLLCPLVSPETGLLHTNALRRAERSTSFSRIEHYDAELMGTVGRFLRAAHNI